MLPFDRKPWAKTVATVVIIASFLGAAALTFYFYNDHSLHISEAVGIVLLLLTIVPPNAAIVMRKPGVVMRKPGVTDPLASPSALSQQSR